MAEKEKVQETVCEELNLEENVTVKSISNWDTTFSRKTTLGDVLIAPNGSMRLTRNEIIAQVQSGTTLFTGTDGRGKHATLYIDDAPTRIYLGFESKDGSEKQDVFTDARVKEVFKIASQDAFEKECRKVFVTRAEKFAVVDAIRRLKINDFSKIRFVENYTGYTV